MSDDHKALRETAREFLMDYFETHRWFADRVKRETGILELVGPVGLDVVMVVGDPERAGGLMVAFHTDELIEPQEHGPLLVIAEESFAALRERCPELAAVPLRAHISY